MAVNCTYIVFAIWKEVWNEWEKLSLKKNEQ